MFNQPFLLSGGAGWIRHAFCVAIHPIQQKRVDYGKTPIHPGLSFNKGLDHDHKMKPDQVPSQLK
jgi:hypothetical protein